MHTHSARIKEEIEEAGYRFEKKPSGWVCIENESGEVVSGLLPFVTLRDCLDAMAHELGIE